jgi:uncharacterized phosphosugar-binding protein
MDDAHLRYAEEARQTIDRIVLTQGEVIGDVSRRCSESILADGLVHLFGSGHSRMAAEEMYPRYGSFPGFHPIVELSLSNHHQVVGANGQRQAMFIENAEGLGKAILANFRFDPARDMMMVVSAGGANAVPIEVAIEARSLGLATVAITSLESSRLSQSRHSSGKRLFEVAEWVIDICTPPGDAAIRIDDLQSPVGPLSSIASLTIINMIKVRVAELLTQAGKPPPVITSSLLAGEERSQELFESSYGEYRERTRRL